MPGGPVELGETLEAALQREILEETGLRIHDIMPLGVQEFVYDPAFWQARHFFFEYAWRADSNEVVLNDEAQESLWVEPAEALGLPVEPYTARAIQIYLERSRP